MCLLFPHDHSSSASMILFALTDGRCLGGCRLEALNAGQLVDLLLHGAAWGCGEAADLWP